MHDALPYLGTTLPVPRMDDHQRFEFDLHGVIVVKGVLDAETVAQLRSIMCVRHTTSRAPLSSSYKFTSVRRGACRGAGTRSSRRTRNVRIRKGRATTPAECAATQTGWATRCCTGGMPVGLLPSPRSTCLL